MFQISISIILLINICVFIEVDIDMAIKNALRACEKRGITGKNITPFVLNEVSRVTKGMSMETSKKKRNKWIIFCIGSILGTFY